MGGLNLIAVKLRKTLLNFDSRKYLHPLLRGCVKTKTGYHFVILSMAKNLNTSIMCLQINPH